MRAKEFLLEVFDKPYPYDWSRFGTTNYKARSILTDGTSLYVFFTSPSKHSEDWDVDFERDFAYDITGQGDAPRIMATVLAALREFVSIIKPKKLQFTAKDTEHSRLSLYDRLVSRYAQELGYTLFRKHPVEDQIQYELIRKSAQTDH